MYVCMYMYLCVQMYEPFMNKYVYYMYLCTCMCVQCTYIYNVFMHVHVYRKDNKIWKKITDSHSKLTQNLKTY